MLYREITAVCSQMHTQHINTLCRQNVEFSNVKPGRIRSWPINWGFTSYTQSQPQNIYICSITTRPLCVWVQNAKSSLEVPHKFGLQLHSRTFKRCKLHSFNLKAPCVLYIRTGVSLFSRERFLYI